MSHEPRDRRPDPSAGEAITTGGEPGVPTSAGTPGQRPPSGPGARFTGDESSGDSIGPYRLLQIVGEGGFGTVWLAERREPMVQRVALKIIKAGMDTKAVVARFEQERQALAVMDHPNIAKVLDAGATAAGRPYFVMELCKGDPISDYCDRNTLNIRQRLELFAQVCNAVQHAHTKGIIHRDLKPSNVLVSTQDGQPSAKVIDFGIAKATASKLTEKTVFTEHKQLIGTPAYMSPEQAEGSLDIDTRTDVYSLGVLLYELLTGTTPFDTRSLLSAGYAEIQRIIREVDPPRPSTRLSSIASIRPPTSAGADAQTVAAPTASPASVLAGGSSLDQIAKRRHTEPRKLGTIVRGELDWIVMKALEKDRSRRYETANGLAADIQRYLRGEAVVAAPPSTTYRITKFIRRNKVMVMAGAAVAAALLIGVFGFAWQAARATRAEAIAKGRLAESEATVRFLDDMLGSVDPLARGKDVTVRAVLDEAAKSVGTQFADRPLVAARLHGTIGRTYLGLSVYDAAEPHVREALAIRRRELGADHPDTCRALNELGVLLIKNGAHAEAETLFKKAIEDHERLFGRHHEITLQSLDGLATLYGAQVRTEEAAPLVKEVLENRMASPGPEHQETTSSMNTLATLYADMGRFDESRKLYESAIAIQDRIAGPDHPYSLEIRANYAWMQYWAAMDERLKDPAAKKKLLESAKVLGEQVLQTRIRVLGEEHQETTTSMNNLASVYGELGMNAEADALRKKDIDISVRVLGEDHPDTITSLSNFGHSLAKQKRFDEGLQYLERAVRGARKVLPPDNQGRAFTLAWYGSCLRDLGRFGEGEPPLLEARGIIGRTMGEDHPIANQMSLSLVMLYDAWEKAEPGKGHDAKAAEWRAKMDAPAKPASGSKPDDKK